MTRMREAALVLLVIASAGCTPGGEGPPAAEGTAAAEGRKASPAAAAEPTIDAPGVEGRVALVAPAERGAGDVPTFEWEAVSDASAYRLAVVDEGGEVVWAWEGAATSVALGGVAERPQGEPGPVLAGPATWSVVAIDVEGDVVAVSPIRAVAP